MPLHFSVPSHDRMKLQTPLLGKYSSIPLFIYDGGCPFCRHFAELSELRSGIKGLRIYDGRVDKTLRDDLRSRGLSFSEGAVLVVDDEAFHGAEAIQWLCTHMNPSAQLLHVLKPLMSTPLRSRLIYPFLRLARLIALACRKLALDPD
ncbi:MAG TPA: DCC1-like thiol-disulfide oxidoreductase family protein [Prochlorococcus sp.]|mgnify:CR=1 FL=1